MEVYATLDISNDHNYFDLPDHCFLHSVYVMFAYTDVIYVYDMLGYHVAE